MHISEYFMWVLTWLVPWMFRSWAVNIGNQWWQTETDSWYQMIHSSLIKQLIILKFIYLKKKNCLIWPLTNIDSVCLEDVLSLMHSDSCLFDVIFYRVKWHIHRIFHAVNRRRKSLLFSHLRSWRICLRISLSKRLEHHWVSSKGLSLYILSFGSSVSKPRPLLTSRWQKWCPIFSFSQ